MTKDVLFSLTKGAYAPQEEMLEIARKKGKLFIGIPKKLHFKKIVLLWCQMQLHYL